ncbi:MAG TPA: alpha/beta hydrolase [Sphingomonas sp.]|nr:alpha/beta hydrolase [Sphingomonas sp.]
MPDISRRMLLQAGSALALLPATAIAQPSAGDEVVQLWPGAMPGDRGTAISAKTDEHSSDPAHPDRWLTGIARPVLIVHRPKRPNGAAVLIVPGGSYRFLAYDNEGTSQARWLNEQGVTAFILLYRLPTEGWNGRADVPLQDAQRAMRVIRAGASGFGVDPAKIAVLGFSAGGHLAGSLATSHAEQVYAPVDGADRISARPDIAGLIYPVITMTGTFGHDESRDDLLGANAPAAGRQRRSIELRVDAQTPPVFLVHAADDGLVPVANSLALYTALIAARRPAELHVFDEGGHGFGVRAARSLPVSAWPRLFTAFAARKGVFPA